MAEEKSQESKTEIEVKDIAEAQAKIAELNKDASINKPSEEEVEAAAKEFNDAKVAFESKFFQIGNPDIAESIYDFAIDFMENHVHWTKNGWMGVIRMHDELTSSKKNRKKTDAFALSYQALEFLFFALSNPGGNGLAAAKAIEAISEMYINLYELTGKALEEARKELKEIQWLGDKAAAMQQGFYMEKEDGIEKDENPLIDDSQSKITNLSAPTADELLDKAE